MFRSVSLFTLLPITNNLIRKKFKLGEKIHHAGEVPQGLFIVKKGYCKVGIDQIVPLEVDEETYVKRRTSSQKDINFTYGPEHRDPLREEKKKPKLELVQDVHNGFGEIQGNMPNNPETIRMMQAHEKSLRKLLPPEKFKARKRLFSDNRFVLLDDESQPFGDNETAVQKFLTFFHLAEKDYFGGRVLIAESNITQEGRVVDENGASIILPSQLSVVADSAEVEVLIMDRSQMPFFPEDVQREIIGKVRHVQNVERPYSDRVMKDQKQKFNTWSR